jgi:hypothetical protein
LLQSATTPSGKSRDEIEAMLPNKDENLATAAWKLYRHHEDDFEQSRSIVSTSGGWVQKPFSHLTPPAQTAFTTLAKYPDVMLFLNDNLDITQQLGKKYISDQSGLKTESWRHNMIVCRSKSSAIGCAYKRELDKNPQAKQS